MSCTCRRTLGALVADEPVVVFARGARSRRRGSSSSPVRLKDEQRGGASSCDRRSARRADGPCLGHDRMTPWRKKSGEIGPCSQARPRSRKRRSRGGGGSRRTPGEFLADEGTNLPVRQAAAGGGYRGSWRTSSTGRPRRLRAGRTHSPAGARRKVGRPGRGVQRHQSPADERPASWLFTGRKCRAQWVAHRRAYAKDRQQLRPFEEVSRPTHRSAVTRGQVRLGEGHEQRGLAGRASREPGPARRGVPVSGPAQAASKPPPARSLLGRTDRVGVTGAERRRVRTQRGRSTLTSPKPAEHTQTEGGPDGNPERPAPPAQCGPPDRGR